MASYAVYVLLSASGERTYVGQTADVETRLSRHNAGCVRSTKANRPWKLLHIEHFSRRAEAIERERWYKSRLGRAAIAAMLARRRGG